MERKFSNSISPDINGTASPDIDSNLDFAVTLLTLPLRPALLQIYPGHFKLKRLGIQLMIYLDLCQVCIRSSKRDASLREMSAHIRDCCRSGVGNEAAFFDDFVFRARENGACQARVDACDIAGRGGGGFKYSPILG